MLDMPHKLRCITLTQWEAKIGLHQAVCHGVGAQNALGWSVVWLWILLLDGGAVFGNEGLRADVSHEVVQLICFGIARRGRAREQ